MARHDQRAKENNFICTKCYQYDCEHCIDWMRMKVFKTNHRLCTCTHEHSVKVTDDSSLHTVPEADQPLRHGDVAPSDDMGSAEAVTPGNAEVSRESAA